MSPSARRDLFESQFPHPENGNNGNPEAPLGACCEDKKMGSEKAPNMMHCPKVGIQETLNLDLWEEEMACTKV